MINPSPFVLLATTLALLVVLVAPTVPPRVRYANSMPQFGSAAVSAVTPTTTVFSEVLPADVTAYVNFTAGSWNFWSTFERQVKAGSDLTSLTAGSFHSIYTYQTGANSLKNYVLSDPVNVITTNVSAVRTVNLAQYNYKINVTATNSSGHVFYLWNSTEYGSATSYSDVPPGTYTFDWVSTGLSRRGVNQYNCTGCGGGHGHVVKGVSYTFWVLPDTVLLTSDATTITTTSGKKKKRVVRKVSNVQDLLKRAVSGEEMAEEMVEDVVEETGK